MARRVIDQGHATVDPAFLHDERQFLQQQWSVLHVMERQHDHLVHQIEHARWLADQAGIPPARDQGVQRHKRLDSLAGA